MYSVDYNIRRTRRKRRKRISTPKNSFLNITCEENPVNIAFLVNITFLVNISNLCILIIILEFLIELSLNRDNIFSL